MSDIILVNFFIIFLFDSRKLVFKDVYICYIFFVKFIINFYVRLIFTIYI